MVVLNRQGGPIQVINATQNNLKHISVKIPSESLTVITGVSGSGKSSLALDTLYAEGQRRYVESLSAYARQFLERIQKPRVTEIRGLRPAIAIRQKNSSRNPRSTVGTVTEIYDYLRLLYARVGTIVCRNCERTVQKDTIDDVVRQVLALPADSRLYLSFPLRGSCLDLSSRPKSVVGLRQEIVANLVQQGFLRLLVNDDPVSILNLPQQSPATLENLLQSRVLLDRLKVGTSVRERLTDSLETCFSEGNGVAEVLVLPPGGFPQTLRFSERFECQYCRIAYSSPEPLLFSFNSPYGACSTCQGFGNTISLDRDLVIPDPHKSVADGAIVPFAKPRYRHHQQRVEEYVRAAGFSTQTAYSDLPPDLRKKIWEGRGKFLGVKGVFSRLEKKKYKMHVRIFISRYRGYTRCPDCDGTRLCPEARGVRLGGRSITNISRLPIRRAHQFLLQLELPFRQAEIAAELLLETRQRLDFLLRVGLDYLTLDRLTSTLSGGEMQRIHLAASLGSSLVGTLYVLDEPSVGLHARDQDRLVSILRQLRDLGNTIVVVEHERAMIEAADHIIDMGPGAGEQGGEVVHCGDLDSLRANPNSITGRYLTQQLKIPVPVFRRSSNRHFLAICGARQHNLKNLTVRIPLGLLVGITGVSGSGKSTLVNHVLYAGLKKLRGEWNQSVGDFDSIEGWEIPGEILLMNQNPIGKTPRSNPATYLKAFTKIREILAGLRESQSRNLTPGSFSFNIPGGRCEACSGAGVVRVEMQFLADVELVCEECRGKRYRKQVLEVSYQGKNIAEILDLTIDQAIDFFRRSPSLVRRLRVLQEVGLGYLRLGQSATALSGGEAQRIKLASYISKKTARQPILIFDEPTTGLHFDDIQKLLGAFNRLIQKGATVIVIEHNLDVIKSADWLIDLGPEGGEGGGFLVAEGTPAQVAQVSASHTGRFLREVLELSPVSMQP